MPAETNTPSTYDFSPLKQTNVSRTQIIALVSILLVAGACLAIPVMPSIVPLLVIVAILAVMSFRLSRQRAEAVEKFAVLNNLLPGEAIIPPAISGLGHDEMTSKAFLMQAGDVPCVVFDYRYVTGEGKSQQIHQLSVAYMQNTKPYPHLFLDGKQNGASYTYQSQQQVALEGDFNDYFNLYIPEGEQVDALSIITPDVMQTLLDGGRPYDIEIINDVVFIIAKNTSYTAEKLPALLQFGANLMHEFDERNISWQSLQLPTESWHTDILRRRTVLRSYAIIIAAIVIIFAYFIVTVVTTS